MTNQIIFNGDIINKSEFSIDIINRAYRFGDSIFETIRIFDGNIPFLHHHFIRLKNSCNIVNYKNPFNNVDELRNEIMKFVNDDFANLKNSRVRLTLFRKADNNIYFVTENTAEYIIEINSLPNSTFQINNNSYKIGTYLDIKKSKTLLSTIKTNNMILHSIAGGKAVQNKLNNMILVNDENNITEALNANIFVVKDF